MRSAVPAGLYRRVRLPGLPVSEPLLTFYQAVARPRWDHPRASSPTSSGRDSSRSAGNGRCGPTASSPGLPAEVGSGVVSDPRGGAPIEIDVAVLAAARPGHPREVLSPGEVKRGRTPGRREVQRLARARDLLQGQGYDTSQTVLACYSGTGFEPGADVMPDGERVLLVGLDRLYAAGRSCA